MNHLSPYSLEPIIEAEILKELTHFEVFFSRMGFKRIDGSVFGLLALAKKPLTSEEIEQTLNLSQSAVSLSLKTLSHFGAIETSVDRDQPGLKSKLHSAKEDSLNIVASVFRKREEEVVADFKRMAIRVLNKSLESSDKQRKKKNAIHNYNM
jgi:DNA-binding transcriptional regulator GbsR (MarR family)